MSSVLEQRDKSFPDRDPAGTADMHAALDLLVSCLEEKRSGLGLVPDDELVEKARSMQERGVFLCGPMKSGTTLLLELLDGHRQLNVLPGDSWLWVRFSDVAKRETFSIEEWRKHWLKRFVNPTGQKPYWLFGENEQNYSSFLDYMDFWYADLPDVFRRPALAVVCSYFCANPQRSMMAETWVEKTPGNEFKTDSIVEHLPSAKFIHIVRDPRENFASIKRLYRTRKWTWDARGTARSLSESFDAAVKNREKLGGNNYLIVRYEDLTSAPSKIMESVVEFLGIDWDDSLLTPTVNTQLAKANTMYKDRQVTGVVRRSTHDKWRQELSLFEQGLIHQTRDHAEKVGFSWEMNGLDCCLKLLFGWTMIGGKPRPE